MLARTPLPLHVDSTMMTCFRSCPEKFNLEFVNGYRPAVISIDLHAGGCFAHALEVVYRSIHLHNHPLDKALEHGRLAFLIAWGDFQIPEWKTTAKTPNRMLDAMDAYFERWSPRTDPVQPYMAADGSPTLEYTFAIPLDDPQFPMHPSGSPFLYSGRFDMLGEYQSRPIVRDEKTTGRSIGSNWAKMWSLRSQFMGYVWACRQAGLDVDSVCVRGIAILKEKIHLAEAIVPYSNYVIDRWYDQLARDLHRMVAMWHEGQFDVNFGETCTSFGTCHFMDVCQSQNPQNWLTDFEVRHWNPLRKNPIDEINTTLNVAGENIHALDTSGRILSHPEGEHPPLPKEVGGNSERGT